MLFDGVMQRFDITSNLIRHMRINNGFSLLLEEFDERCLRYNFRLGLVSLLQDFFDTLRFETLHVFGELAVFE